jgi:lysophospholipase L1-like esterase
MAKMALVVCVITMFTHIQSSAQNIPCLIIGDSIAVGAAQFAEGCYSAAQNGIKSRKWLQLWNQLPPADKVLIALGTNDSNARESAPALEEIRRRLQKTATQVAWIAPDSRFPARAVVIETAKMYGDTVYESPKENLGRDRIHYTVTGYKRMAAAVKN